MRVRILATSNLQRVMGQGCESAGGVLLPTARRLRNLAAPMTPLMVSHVCTWDLGCTDQGSGLKTGHARSPLISAILPAR